MITPKAALSLRLAGLIDFIVRVHPAQRCWAPSSRLHPPAPGFTRLHPAAPGLALLGSTLSPCGCARLHLAAPGYPMLQFLPKAAHSLGLAGLHHFRLRPQRCRGPPFPPKAAPGCTWPRRVIPDFCIFAGRCWAAPFPPKAAPGPAQRCWGHPISS